MCHLQWACQALKTALEKITCRVLGDLLQEGMVANFGDDFHCGGNIPDELLHNWRRVSHAMYRCNLCLSASKIVICSKSTTIL